MFPLVAGSLLVWAIAAKAVFDGKVVFRFDWMPVWTRAEQPKAFWRFVTLMIVAGLLLLAFAYLTRNVPPRQG
jgi:hypothetical protein